MPDYNQLFLTTQELRILDKISSGAVLRLHAVNAEYLLKLGFISKYNLADRTDEYVVTPEGLRYTEYLDNKRAIDKNLAAKQARKERREMVATWVSIVLSNLIAFAALLISIVK